MCVGLKPSQVADDSYEYNCNACAMMTDVVTPKSAVPDTPAPCPLSLKPVSELLASNSPVKTSASPPHVAAASGGIKSAQTLPAHFIARATVVNNNLRPLIGAAALPPPRFSVVAGPARPSLGLFASVSSQPIGSVRLVDKKGGPDGPALNSLGYGTIVNSLSTVPAATLVGSSAAGASLSFGQYLYTPWMNSSVDSAVASPR